MMAEELLSRLPVSHGHFLLESGYHTDLWFDLDALFVSPHTLAPLVKALADKIRPYGVAATCGPLLGGAFLAQSLAIELGCHFYLTQPEEQSSNRENLYGAVYRLSPALQQLIKGERVAVVDDVISAGSSVRATVSALNEARAQTIAIGTFMILGNSATQYFAQQNVPVEALLHRELKLWNPSECSLCKEGIELTDPTQS